MVQPADALRHISGGRVLDVATGSGGFVHTLIDGLRDFDEIIGIDADPDVAEGFADAFRHRADVRFVTMDATQPAFEEGSFGTVAISNSLHHFADPEQILRQMVVMLRPHGHLVMAEMYRDHQRPAQVTHVRLHHWAAALDALDGIVHRRTYTRRQLLRLVERLDLVDLRLTDVADESDAREAGTLAQIDRVIDRQLQRAVGHPELESEGTSIRRRVHRIGIQGATTLIAVGRKA